MPPVYACHCHICQRASGSAFSVQALVAESSLAVTDPIRQSAMVRGAPPAEFVAVPTR